MDLDITGVCRFCRVNAAQPIGASVCEKHMTNALILSWLPSIATIWEDEQGAICKALAKSLKSNTTLTSIGLSGACHPF
eukprot:6208267-Pleurochrysis_carterae.AAC.7